MANYASRLPGSLSEHARQVAEQEALDGFKAWLAASPDAPPMPGDELPEEPKG